MGFGRKKKEDSAEEVEEMKKELAELKAKKEANMEKKKEEPQEEKVEIPESLKNITEYYNDAYGMLNVSNDEISRVLFAAFTELVMLRKAVEDMKE